MRKINMEESMILTGKQIKKLAELPDDDETELWVEACEDGHSGPGFYVSWYEYPDEGSVFLGGDDHVGPNRHAVDCLGDCCVRVIKGRLYYRDGVTEVPDAK